MQKIALIAYLLVLNMTGFSQHRDPIKIIPCVTFTNRPPQPLPLNTKPYYAEYREGGRIITFRGNILPSHEVEVRALQTKYLENLNKAARFDYEEQLRSCGVIIEEITNDPKIHSENAQPVYPLN